MATLNSQKQQIYPPTFHNKQGYREEKNIHYTHRCFTLIHQAFIIHSHYSSAVMKSRLVFTVNVWVMTVLHVCKQFNSICIAVVYHSFGIIGERASSRPERESQLLPQWKEWSLKDTWLHEYLFWHGLVQARVDVGVIGGIQNVPMTWPFPASCSSCSRISRAVLWSAEETWLKSVGFIWFKSEKRLIACL